MIQNIKTSLVVCNVCSSDDAKLLFCAIDRLHGFDGTFQYVQCKNCGLVYMNPQIDAEQLSRFYPADYAPHRGDASKTSTKATQPGLPSEILQSLNSQSRVLDVGCGSGGFLHRMRQAYHCQVFGVDFSQNAVTSAKEQYNLDIIHGRIFDVPFSENSFDLVTAWSCIEHVDDPAAMIEKIRSLCNTGGQVFIKTPNIRSIAAYLFRNKWYHLDCPRHLYLFCPATITKLLTKFGFQDIRIEYDASSKGWLGSLQYVFYGDNYRPEVKNNIRRSALAKAIVSPLSRLSALLKWSDTITITARKPNETLGSIP